MKTDKIIWGLIFVFIGSVFMLDNFNVIDFYWGSVWRFWPIIFILVGANMLFSRFENKAMVPFLTAGVTIAVLAFIGYQGSQPREQGRWMHFEFDNDKRNKKRDWSQADLFVEPYAATKYASLNVQGGATTYKLQDTTAELFKAEVKEPAGGYSLERSTLDSVEVLNFHGRDRKRGFKMDDMDTNETRIQINPNPIWDIEVEMGAGNTKFDLEHFKVRNLSFEGGAAAFYAKIGSKQPVTDVRVETGVASVQIEVPSESGTRIVVDSGLSSKNFRGFVKQGDGSYKSPNYDKAANKVNINLQGGLSSFEVRTY